jgi:hypothetical protein
MILVSGDGSKYPGFAGRFVAIDPRTGVTRESTFAEELVRLSKASQAPH